MHTYIKISSIHNLKYFQINKKKKNEVKDIIATIEDPIKLKLKQPLIIIIKSSGGKKSRTRITCNR